MVNRNAAKHLLLVVSILICFFAYMGYRLYGRTDSPPEDTSGEITEIPGSSSLRPRGATPDSSGGDDPEGWIPSARGDDLALIPIPGSQKAPSGLIPEATMPAANSGAITGLIPAPPSSGASSAIRPPADSLPPQLVPPSGANPFEEEGVTELPPSFLPPGLKPPGAASEAAAGSSAFLPPFGGGSDTPDADEIAMPPPPAAASPAVVRPPVASDDFSTPPSGFGRQERENDRETAPVSSPVTRPPAPVTESRPAPVVESRPVTAPPPPSTRPVRPVQEYYDEDYYEDEDDGPAGSETLRIYVVRPGDTLSNIAARELGSISLADNIFLLNRDVIEDPDHLMVGVKIRLPIRDGFIPQDSDPSSVASGRKPTYGTGRSHTVARGDTLSSIALRYYGSSAAWRFLYEANKTVVPNPNQLSVGTELSIPPYED